MVAYTIMKLNILQFKNCFQIKNQNLNGSSFNFSFSYEQDSAYKDSY